MTNEGNIQEAILRSIEQYQTIIIHRHMRPDPDALGSQVGLAEILRASFPEKTIYQVGGEVGDLDFFATMEEISDEHYKGALVIVTDTANSPRISDQRFNLGDHLIKIDHHPNDEPYGDIVWVNTNASSCSEMITAFWSQFQDKLVMTDEAARLLYGGIVGDTGRFLYPSTTSTTFDLAAKLRAFNFDASQLNRQISQIPLKVARLSGFVYTNLEADENGAAKVIFTKEMMEEYGVNDSQTAGVVSVPGNIEEVLAWGIFVQQPDGTFRCRLRSKGPVINELAKKHDGGGHPLASGANAKDLTEINEIYAEIQQLCKEYMTEHGSMI